VVRDIIFFYYYSSPSLPDKCFFKLKRDIAYRNMFLFRCPDGKIHFEFPIFEDHSYNTICNINGVRSLIKRPSDNEKYIIFRTYNQDTKEKIITGYYQVGREYYQMTWLFNNNGFVCGIEASEAHLMRKDALIYDGPTITCYYRVSWRSDKWNETLNALLERILREEDISDQYQSETNRLISFFQDEEKIKEWRENCRKCNLKRNCALHRRYSRYNNAHSDFDMFSVVHRVYTTNLYSRNELSQIPKLYLR